MQLRPVSVLRALTVPLWDGKASLKQRHVDEGCEARGLAKRFPNILMPLHPYLKHDKNPSCSSH